MGDGSAETASASDAPGGRKGPAQVLYLKRNCLDDGPGIRTVIFFKGCPLRCVWCHNPESQRMKPELSFDADRCVDCGTCREVCPRGALNCDNPAYVDRTRCDLCFKCAESCPAKALERMGKPMGVSEVLAAIRKDLPFYRTSGGGVTLSGGEPTLYMEYLSELLRQCRQLEVHALIETCGLFDFEPFSELLYPWLNEIYFDIKIIDAEAHKKYCGVNNRPILDNFRRLQEKAAAGGLPLLPRTPLIPRLTDTDENLAAIAAFLRECGVNKVALLPYNPTWGKKSLMLGATRQYTEDKFMEADELERCRAHFPDFFLF